MMAPKYEQAARLRAALEAAAAVSFRPIDSLESKPDSVVARAGGARIVVDLWSSRGSGSGGERIVGGGGYQGKATPPWIDRMLRALTPPLMRRPPSREPARTLSAAQARQRLLDAAISAASGALDAPLDRIGMIDPNRVNAQAAGVRLTFVCAFVGARDGLGRPLREGGWWNAEVETGPPPPVDRSGRGR